VQVRKTDFAEPLLLHRATLGIAVALLHGARGST